MYALEILFPIYVRTYYDTLCLIQCNWKNVSLSKHLCKLYNITFHIERKYVSPAIRFIANFMEINQIYRSMNIYAYVTISIRAQKEFVLHWAKPWRHWLTAHKVSERLSSFHLFWVAKAVEQRLCHWNPVADLTKQAYSWRNCNIFAQRKDCTYVQHEHVKAAHVRYFSELKPLFSKIRNGRLFSQVC